MSFTFIFLMMLLGSSVVIAFILQPPKEEPAASANSSGSHLRRCHGESLQSTRKGLLRALNLQVEPQLPAGGLDGVREQWRSTFSNIADRASDAVVPLVSVTPDGGNSASMNCCSVASEIFMKDLGWDSWVIHPASITVVHCALCNPEENTVQCPTSHTNAQDADSQVQMPCCQPTSQEMVPVVYVDESSAVIISSVQLTHSCGCGGDSIRPPSED